MAVRDQAAIQRMNYRDVSADRSGIGRSGNQGKI